MNLLPKTYKEFGERDYWNTFFKKRGNKAFEWYGEYLELCGQLHKYAKPKDDILIAGCGNSSLSADLYDVGYTSITNIDVSEVVIKQMKSINAHREKMKFICMDALSMSFENEAFSVILDKGTLDALMPDDSPEVHERIDKYFSEIKRVLRMGGRYVCVSLLQEHILRKVVATFGDRSWILRVVRCHEAEQRNQESGDGNTLPVFVVIATKFKELPLLMLEVCMAGERMQRLGAAEEVLEAVKSVQDAAVVTNGLANNSLVGQSEVSLDMWRPGDATPRYTVHILDQLHAPPANKYAVFIVPQGRELDWMFSTAEGRKQLMTSARFGRLVVATLHRGHTYPSLDVVKDELSDSAKTLAPKGFVGQIPFLSLGADVGRRERVAAGRSPVSGEFVVEDVEVEGETFRRLIFMSNQFLVQSEAKLKTIKPKGKPKRVVDIGHLACNHHCYMSVGVQLSRANVTAAEVAVIGLGGGGLCSFLQRCFDNVNITAVDIDEAIYTVAVEHFDLTPGDRLKVQIEDGIEFLRNEAERGRHYEAILLDVDSKDRSISLSCPPRPFLDEAVLDNVSTLISDTGHFFVNLVCRDAELHAGIMHSLQAHFRHLLSIQVDQEVNQVVFATNRPQGYTADDIDDAAKNLNCTARNKKLVKLKCLDIKNMLECLSIHS